MRFTQGVGNLSSFVHRVFPLSILVHRLAVRFATDDPGGGNRGPVTISPPIAMGTCCTCAGVYPGRTLRSGIAGSCATQVHTFTGRAQTGFQTVCLTSHACARRAGTPYQPLPFLPARGACRVLVVVCVGIFPAALDVEHVLLGFLSFGASVLSMLLMFISDFPLIVFNILPATGLPCAREHRRRWENQALPTRPTVEGLPRLPAWPDFVPGGEGEHSEAGRGGGGGGGAAESSSVLALMKSGCIAAFVCSSPQRFTPFRKPFCSLFQK